MFLARALALGTVLLALTGCPPRGETRTLDQVVESAYERYESVRGAAPEGELRAAIERLTAMLGDLLEGSGEARGPELAAVAATLEQLLPRAGFTARPALNELTLQYRALAEAAPPSAPAVKLIVARTYSALASELESTRFGL